MCSSSKKRPCEEEVVSTNTSLKQPLQKRKCAHSIDAGLVFSIVTQPAEFKALIENISNVIRDIEIRAVKTPDFEGIKIETIDEKKACMVVARLPCDVTLNSNVADNEVKFCISADSMMTILRQVDVQYTLTLSQRASDARIIIHSFDNLTQTDTLTVELATKHMGDADPIRLKEISAKFQVEMKLSEFRSVLKLCSDGGAEDVNLIVREVPESSDGAGDGFDVLTVHGDGTSYDISKQFRSLKTGGDGDIIRVNDENSGNNLSSDGRIIFDESYSVSYLSKIVRSMPRTIVKLSMGPGLPIYVEYPLGGRDAEIKYVLAPKIKD